MRPPADPYDTGPLEIDPLRAVLAGLLRTPGARAAHAVDSRRGVIVAELGLTAGSDGAAIVQLARAAAPVASGADGLDDMVVTTRGSVHLLRECDEPGTFLHVRLDREKADVEAARRALRVAGLQQAVQAVRMRVEAATAAQVAPPAPRPSPSPRPVGNGLPGPPRPAPAPMQFRVPDYVPAPTPAPAAPAGAARPYAPVPAPVPGAALAWAPDPQSGETPIPPPGGAPQRLTGSAPVPVTVDAPAPLPGGASWQPPATQAPTPRAAPEWSPGSPPVALPAGASGPLPGRAPEPPHPLAPAPGRASEQPPGAARGWMPAGASALLTSGGLEPVPDAQAPEPGGVPESQPVVALAPEPSPVPLPRRVPGRPPSEQQPALVTLTGLRPVTSTGALAVLALQEVEQRDAETRAAAPRTERPRRVPSPRPRPPNVAADGVLKQAWAEDLDALKRVLAGLRRLA
ncbi:hypothetical protein GCM10010464_74470 [Pseudonocardia yunnanensis]|uniref:Roadblock/LAMTOR2 domain-containing protein n=1 Tax=Pseudonocardia yunnanensis TaxID=58107 RepID=A0ABW4F251_9PSEU